MPHVPQMQRHVQESPLPKNVNRFDFHDNRILRLFDSHLHLLTRATEGNQTVQTLPLYGVVLLGTNDRKIHNLAFIQEQKVTNPLPTQICASVKRILQ